jgi:hypothetical protein
MSASARMAEQQRVIFVLLAGFEMGKHPAELRPPINFKQEVSDLDARQSGQSTISSDLFR